jgi:hypothetical protein
MATAGPPGPGPFQVRVRRRRGALRGPGRRRGRNVKVPRAGLPLTTVTLVESQAGHWQADSNFRPLVLLVTDGGNCIRGGTWKNVH